jgi:hypothetical protein
MRFFWGVFSGGVAALNHRLIAAMPPASDPSLSMIRSPKGYHKPRHSGAVSIGFSSHPKNTVFYYTVFY